MSDPTEPNNVVADAGVIRTTVEEAVALVRQLLALAGKTETKFDLGIGPKSNIPGPALRMRPARR
jgi:hypothetical protein